MAQQPRSRQQQFYPVPLLPTQVASRRTDDVDLEQPARWPANSVSNRSNNDLDALPSPDYRTIEHHLGRIKDSRRSRPVNTYSNLETYTKSNKDSSLPNVRSRSTLNEINMDKTYHIGKKKMEKILNKTRDHPPKHSSLPQVNQPKAKLASTSANIKIRNERAQ